MAPRSVLSALFLLIPAACASPAAQPVGLTAEDEAAIRAIHAQWSENAAADRFIDNLELYAPDAAELVGVARVGLPAIRERWEGFLPDYEWTASEATVKEMGGTGDEAWVWTEFTNRYKLRGEPRVQRGNQLAIMRKQPDGAWKFHRVTWQAVAAPDTASAGGN